MIFGMTYFDFFAQAIGILAMAIIIISFQQKTHKKVVTFQLFGCILFAVNFFMLGALVGAFMNVISVLRALVYSNKEKFRGDHKGWMALFMFLYVLSYVLTFVVFGTEFNLRNATLELLPVIAMVVTTVGFSSNSAKLVRLFGLVNSPCWLVYNIVNFALGGILCEVFSLCSIFIGMFRHDRKKQNV